MKSKTSFFNKKIFFNNLARFWPIWAAYLALWIIILPLGVGNAYDFYGDLSVAANARSTILEIANIGGIICALGGGFIGAAAVFAYSFSTRSSNFFASLPIKREGLFVTNYLSGLFWFIAANIIVFILSAISLGHLGELVMSALCSWFGIVTLQMVVFYSIAVFCVAISGNLWGYLFSYAALNCVPIICEAITKFLNSLFLRGIDFDTYFATRIVTPAYYLFSDILRTYDDINHVLIRATYGGWSHLIAYAIVGIILAVIGLVIYRNRHMEYASDLIAEKKLRPVFKYALTFFSALTIGMALYVFLFYEPHITAPIVPIICMLIGGFVGYFGSEMLLNKSFRVFKKWVGYAVSAVIIIAFVFTLKADIFHIEKYVPDNSSIECVDLFYGYADNSYFENAQDIAQITDIHKDLINDDGTFVAESEYYEFSPVVNQFTVHIRYHLKSGRLVERAYTLGDTNTANANKVFAKFDKLLNSQEAIMNRTARGDIINAKNIQYCELQTFNDHDGYIHYDLAPHDVRDIYENAILPDIQDGKIGAIDVKNPWTVYECYCITFEVEVPYEAPHEITQSDNEVIMAEEGYSYEYYEFRFDENATRTAKAVKELIESGKAKMSYIG